MKTDVNDALAAINRPISEVDLKKALTNVQKMFVSRAKSSTGTFPDEN
jgi:hypothetical protein